MDYNRAMGEVLQDFCATRLAWVTEEAPPYICLNDQSPTRLSLHRLHRGHSPWEPNESDIRATDWVTFRIG